MPLDLKNITKSDEEEVAMSQLLFYCPDCEKLLLEVDTPWLAKDDDYVSDMKDIETREKLNSEIVKCECGMEISRFEIKKKDLKEPEPTFGKMEYHYVPYINVGDSAGGTAWTASTTTSSGAYYGGNES